MLATIEVINLFLSAVTMSTALAHALEFPGKMRLTQSTYLAVQTIYYPGFTLAGIAEPLSAISLWCSYPSVVLPEPRPGGCLPHCIAAVLMHIVFWVVTQPINRHWLKGQHLNRAGAEFFGTESKDMPTTETYTPHEWELPKALGVFAHRALPPCDVFAHRDFHRSCVLDLAHLIDSRLDAISTRPQSPVTLRTILPTQIIAEFSKSSSFGFHAQASRPILGDHGVKKVPTSPRTSSIPKPHFPGRSQLLSRRLGGLTKIEIACSLRTQIFSQPKNRIL